jgi:hypothetical protein
VERARRRGLDEGVGLADEVRADRRRPAAAGTEQLLKEGNVGAAVPRRQQALRGLRRQRK